MTSERSPISAEELGLNNDEFRLFIQFCTTFALSPEATFRFIEAGKKKEVLQTISGIVLKPSAVRREAHHLEFSLALVEKLAEISKIFQGKSLTLQGIAGLLKDVDHPGLGVCFKALTGKEMK